MSCTDLSSSPCSVALDAMIAEAGEPDLLPDTLSSSSFFRCPDPHLLPDTATTLLRNGLTGLLELRVTDVTDEDHIQEGTKGALPSFAMTVTQLAR